MSNFLKKGQRLQKAAEKKEVKKRIKRMYEIMNELDDVAISIIKSGEEYTEDTIAEVASKYTDLKIDAMEKFLLLGKLQNFKDNYERAKQKITGDERTDGSISVSDTTGGGDKEI